MNKKELKTILDQKGLPKFRWMQIKKAIFQEGCGTFDEITTLSKDLRAELDKEFKVLSFEVEEIQASESNNSIKAIIKTHDGHMIETVLIKGKGDHWTACVSSQAGCALKCTFCATGAGGFKRNLTAEEISDQILFWIGYLKKNTSLGELANIVYMGMGEPFLNWENVRESLMDLIDEDLFGFGSRSISVSTSGITTGISRFAKEFPQMNLAISLHSAFNQKRDDLMPINKKFDLIQLQKAIENYFERSNRKVMIEYLMIDGVNDAKMDARYLAEFLLSFKKNQLLHVNLIPYNPIPGSKYRPSPEDRVEKFKQMIMDAGINTTIRKSLGGEIDGACGQLAGKKREDRKE